MDDAVSTASRPWCWTWLMPPLASVSMMRLPIIVAVSGSPLHGGERRLAAAGLDRGGDLLRRHRAGDDVIGQDVVGQLALFSGFTSVSTVPAGSFLNAASVGAKTVKGPGPDSVSTRPAAFTAATSVVRLLASRRFRRSSWSGTSRRRRPSGSWRPTSPDRREQGDGGDRAAELEAGHLRHPLSGHPGAVCGGDTSVADKDA